MPRIYGQSLLAALLLVLTLATTPAGGQETPGGPPEQGGGPPIRVLVEEVNVQFIVTDNDNRLLTNLNQDSFDVLEDKKPQTIVGFSRESDLPLRVGLLIDTSNSVRDRFQFEQRASAEFLRTLLRRGKDKALLGSFDSVAELVQDFTDDTEKLVTAIDSLRPGGGTALYDAVFYACRDRLIQEAPSQSVFRRALVILSDGEDNQSRYTRQQAMDMAQRAEVTIYTITTNIRGTQMPGDKVLRDLSEQTGGRYFQPRTWDELDDAFQAINTELRSQYNLSYKTATARDGRYHEIQIVPKNKDLRVRARRGYFALQQGEQPAAGSSPR